MSYHLIGLERERERGRDREMKGERKEEELRKGGSKGRKKTLQQLISELSASILYNYTHCRHMVQGCELYNYTLYIYTL